MISLFGKLNGNWAFVDYSIKLSLLFINNIKLIIIILTVVTPNNFASLSLCFVILPEARRLNLRYSHFARTRPILSNVIYFELVA